MIKDEHKNLYFAISNCFNKNDNSFLEDFINRHRDYLISESFNDEMPYKIKLAECVEIDRKNGFCIYNEYRLNDDDKPYLIEAIYLTKIEPKQCIYFRGDYVGSNTMEIVKVIAENSMGCLILIIDDRGEDEIEVFRYKRQLTDIAKFPKLKEMIELHEKKELELQFSRREIYTFLNN